TFFGESRAHGEPPHEKVHVEPASDRPTTGGAQVHIVVPNQHLNAVLDELQVREARISQRQPQGESTVIDAWISTAKMIYLKAALRDMTNRSATVTVQYDYTPSKPHTDHGHPHAHGHAHESPPVMLAPLVILAVLSVAGGWIGIPEFLGGGN